jgi:hypothetical protein
MTGQTIAELLAATAKLDELPLGTVRELLALRPQARELADRLEALEKNVGGLLAVTSAPGAATAQPAPVAAPRTAAILVEDDDGDESRWTLLEEHIEPGIIAYFDTDTLNTDDKVSKPQWLVNNVTKKMSRPCVCISADETDLCCWLALTSKYNDRGAHPKLQPGWIVNNTAAQMASGWVTQHYYAGPKRSFCIAAAQTEHPALRFKRPRLSPAGLKAVLAFAQQAGLNT